MNRAFLLVITLLLAMLASFTDAVSYFQFKTESVKGVSCAVENKPLGPYYIPDNQCSGVLYDLPRNCERLELVKVTVMDYSHVKLSIDDTLSSASIEREPNLAGECPGRAMVRAQLGCAGRLAAGVPASSRAAEADYILPAQ